MANFEGTSTLKRAMISSSAPPKRSINGLALMLSQRASSTSRISTDAPKDADRSPSPPPSSAAAAAASLPPAPPSTHGVGGHFAQFRSQNFEPDASAPFSDEWERLRSSQGWVPGSQAYKRERARALRNELRAAYFPSLETKEEEQDGESIGLMIKVEEDKDVTLEEGGRGGDGRAEALPALVKKEDTDEDKAALAKLVGFQAMCRDVGQQPGGTIDECKTALRATLVNIVDLIDNHRTGQAVHVWTDFDSFRAYTTQPDKTMPLEEAKKDELLACFLKKVRAGGGRSRHRGGRGVSKKVKKREPSPGLGSGGERERKRPRREM